MLCCTEDQTRSESGLKMSHKMQSHPWVEGTQVLFCAAECQCSKRDRQSEHNRQEAKGLGRGLHDLKQEKLLADGPSVHM